MIMPPLPSPQLQNGLLDPSLPLKVRRSDRPVDTYLSVFNNDVSEVVSAKNVPYVFLSKPGLSFIAHPVYGNRRRPTDGRDGVRRAVRPSNGHVIPTTTTTDDDG